ncbi:hypothetical protein EOM09_05610 [bacterium]|nr:hypothetical protein [bacterium]
MSNKKPRKRAGFFGIKLTEDHLKFQVDNYTKLKGLSSSRAKASFWFMIVSFLNWLYLIGSIENVTKETGYFFLFILILLAWGVYKKPKISLKIILVLFSIFALLSIIGSPYAILSSLTSLYILLYILYPAYQVEIKRIN